MPKKPTYPLSRSECLCAICREILLEPVTLPCSHTLCCPCFQMTVEKASLCCPFCRLRVSSWTRHNTRSGTLVNKELWEIIQRQYPEECHRRACGLDTGEDEFEDDFTPYPVPQLCKPGEIRLEYEAEISKIEAERLSREEEERKASEEYIQKLLEAEEAEQRLSVQRAQWKLEEQMKKDEELARMLSSDLNESTASSVHISPSESPVVHKKTVSTKSCKNVKRNRAQSGDIERFLSPKSVKIFSTEGFRHVRNGDLQNMNIGTEYASNLLDESDDDDEMPTLTPCTLTSSPIVGSDLEYQLPGLTKYSPTRSVLQAEGSSTNSYLGQTIPNETLLTMATAEFSPPRCSSSLDSSKKCLNINNMPEDWHKRTPKRNLNFCGDMENYPSQKRPCLENSTTPRCHTEKLMELEETLHERRLQEEQDRLLALKLQKLLDKEVSQVSRQKGSPDEYKLRPKTSTSQQKSLEPEPLKRMTSQHSTEHSSSKSSESGESSDENKKPASRKLQQPLLDGGRRKSSGQPNGETILKPSNKQQNILDMFKRSTRK